MQESQKDGKTSKWNEPFLSNLLRSTNGYFISMSERFNPSRDHVKGQEHTAILKQSILKPTGLLHLETAHQSFIGSLRPV
jgi:hypothetical protein